MKVNLTDTNNHCRFCVMADYYQESFKLHWDPKVERHGLGTLLKKVNHVAIIVSDVNKSLSFYVEVLGLQQIRRPNFDRHGAWLTMGNVELHLIKGIPTVVRGDHLIVPHISVESDDIEAVLNKLNQMKVPFSRNVSVPDAAESQPITQYFLRDPDGYYIELCNCDQLTNFCLGTDKHGVAYNELVEQVPMSLVFKLAHLALKGKDASGERVVIPPRAQWACVPDRVKLGNMLSRCNIYGDLMQNETMESISLALRQAGNNVPLATKIIRDKKRGKETFVPPAFFKQGQEKYQPTIYEFSPRKKSEVAPKYDVIKDMNNVLGEPENRCKSFLAMARKTFDHFDKDHDGYLSKEELSNVLVSLRIKLYETKFVDKFKSADANDDDVITFEEFLDFIKQMPPMDDKAQWEAFFNMLDLDGNNKITCPELAMVLREMNIEMNDSGLENLFIEIDEDGNGYLTIDEVREFFENNL